MDCVVHEVAKSQTQLSNFHFHKMQSTGVKKTKIHNISTHSGSLGLFPFTFTFRFHALEKEMATHSSVLA